MSKQGIQQIDTTKLAAAVVLAYLALNAPRSARPLHEKHPSEV